MIFEGLNSLRRNAIMTSIVLLSFGIVLLILPELYLQPLIEGMGAVMIIISLEMIFDFLNSRNSLINFIALTAALALGIAGIAVLIFQDDVIFVLGALFGVILIISGLHGIFHAWVYARRSQRQGWWMLIPCYVLLIVLGILIIFNPWWTEPSAFKQVIGLAIVLSSIVSALRLIWVWPIRKG